MNLMKNQKHQSENKLALKGGTSNWVLESKSKKIVMKQSPERKRMARQYEDGEEDVDEEEYQAMKRDIEEMRQQEQQMGSDDESYDDQLEVEEPWEETPKKQILSPGKSSQSAEDKDSQYSPHKVVQAMMARKDRKIPNSVLKPHAEEVILILSSTFTINPAYRVFFPYPKYC